ncbi:MAG: efflux RND transporter periplasmic adaptor subunit [Myxococcota bacterium]
MPFNPLGFRVLGVGTLPLVLALLGTGCRSETANAAPGPRPLPVRVAVVKLEPGYTHDRWYTGSVRSSRASALGFQRGGELLEVRVDEGDSFSQGQVVARLESASLRAERRRLQAQLREAESQVGLARVTSDRISVLASSQHASLQQRDEAAFGLQATVAREDQLRAAIALIDVQLRQSTLRAPFSGTVAERLADEGTVVAAGTPVIQALESGPMEAVIGIPVVLRRLLTTGTHIELEADGQRIHGTVTGFVASLERSTRTTQAIVALSVNATLVEGQVIRLNLPKPVDSPGAWLPLGAMTRGTRGLWTVYSMAEVEDHFIAERQLVEVLHLGEDRAFVRGTVIDGQRVIAEGLNRIVAGQRVEPADEREATR